MSGDCINYTEMYTQQYQREIYKELYHRSVNIDRDIPGYSILRCFQLSAEYLKFSETWATFKKQIKIQTVKYRTCKKIISEEHILSEFYGFQQGGCTDFCTSKLWGKCDERIKRVELKIEAGLV